MSRWFITGTDTEVGKTVVTACLAQAARAWGSVVAAKPVASGVVAGAVGEDEALLAQAAGHQPLGLYRFCEPLSPHRAAILENRSVEPQEMINWVSSLEADTVLVEGVGGFKVPLSLEPSFDVADLAVAFGGKVVIVAADRLGVLNHTLLTVDAVRRCGLEIGAVVLNRGLGTSLRTNLLDLQQLLSFPVLTLETLDPGDSRQREEAGNRWCRTLLC
ncbi:MAG: dethiobiotin synthase [Proteobacteria bacterium]|jgi:dethiobiotin synthetase|nr:dethiobiotin synthase [Pseudomonadota bacterium]